jgi:1,4-dihydroxy-6-naphthoate synthase
MGYIPGEDYMSDSHVISLAYSVDADDAFMFHALRHGRIDAEGLTFTHRRDHTAALNRLAEEGGADVVAVSLGAYPALARTYQLLPHGASVGRGFGPVVVARRPMTPAALAGARVGIPGRSTTAWLVLRLIEPAAVGVEIPIFPFARIFEALDAGEIDAALLIHEGRLLYPERGLHKVVDLGEWWQAEAGLPLPLGVNVIRRALRPALVSRVSRVLRASIAWALANRGEIIAELAGEDRGEKALSKPELIDHYLNLYANADTAAIADDARRAVDVLFARARAAGLVGADVSADWSD